MTLIEKADALAAHAHEGQMRKDAPTPYITHPRAVAATLKKYGFNDTVIAAALVHDVLEDTACTPAELEAQLGPEVLRIVQMLSYDPSLEWEEQRKKYIEAVRAAPPEVKAISTADKVHNLETLLDSYARTGPQLWNMFTRKKERKLWFEREMLKMLQETWRHPLVDEYARLLALAEALPE
ncbi:MAG: HD domain-containing protein [Patescibacteria group bacterium]